MQETRRARIASMIQQELSLMVPKDVKDPRVPMVTFTGVELTPDAGQATVFVALFGEPASAISLERTLEEDQAAAKRMKNCLEGLNSASGFLRKQLGRIITVRHIPYLLFREDKGFTNATRVHELLKKIAPPTDA